MFFSEQIDMFIDFSEHYFHSGKWKPHLKSFLERWNRPVLLHASSVLQPLTFIVDYVQDTGAIVFTVMEEASRSNVQGFPPYSHPIFPWRFKLYWISERGFSFSQHMGCGTRRIDAGLLVWIYSLTVFLPCLHHDADGGIRWQIVKTVFPHLHSMLDNVRISLRYCQDKEDFMLRFV